MPWWYDPKTVIDPALLEPFGDPEDGPLTPGGVPVSLVEADSSEA
jgi:hypothetical protein